MLTAMGQEEDIVKGLETGGDDYITKPFSLDIISARIKSVLRRSTINQNDIEKTINKHVLSLDRVERGHYWKYINLTFTEFQILFFLLLILVGYSQGIRSLIKLEVTITPLLIDLVDFPNCRIKKKDREKGKPIMTIRELGINFSRMTHRPLFVKLFFRICRLF